MALAIRSPKDFWAGLLYGGIGATAVIIAREYSWGRGGRWGLAVWNHPRLSIAARRGNGVPVRVRGDSGTAGKGVDTQATAGSGGLPPPWWNEASAPVASPFRGTPWAAHRRNSLFLRGAPR